MMRRMFSIALLCALSACADDGIENVQAEAANQSRRLEQRAAELEAEAGNRVAAQTAPLDNEAEALLNQLAPANDANAALPEANAQ